MISSDRKAAFFTLYAGLLKGLNLVHQRGWDEQELQHFFPDIKDQWLPYLQSRHQALEVTSCHWEALESCHQILKSWNDPVEKKILENRLNGIAQYYRETQKKFCDEQTLKFYLGTHELTQLNPSLTTRPFSTSTEKLTSVEAKAQLEADLIGLFPEHDTTVKLSSRTLARASTGKHSIRLRKDYEYSKEELEQLTVHEGWVHLGSNLQGSLQSQLPWLAHWHPSVTSFQEGLALIAEIVGGCWTERRQWEIIRRHQAALLALRGWNAKEVYHWLLDKGIGAESSLSTVLRVYRGCSLEGGMAFGKELLYVSGLQEWTKLSKEISSEDMQVALAGKMSFSEWHLLKSTLKHKLLLAQIPEVLAHWTEHFQIQTLRFKLPPAA